MTKNRYATHGRILIEGLKRRAMTYRDMTDFMRNVSTSPWKRAAEGLRPEEQIIKAKNAQGLVTWRVVQKEKS